MKDIPERDWKFMKSIEKEMLEELCQRINEQALQILKDDSLDQHEKFLSLYRHLIVMNKVVADCFNDWRRSVIFERMIMLLRHQLLKEEHISKLSKETQDRIKQMSDWIQSKG